MNDPDETREPSARDPARVLFPLFLDLTARRVLVVGAGAVAARKALDLTLARAEVRVVAPDVGPAFAPPSHASMTVERRPFEERDVEGAWLVFAATGDPAVQQRVAIACERARVFCVAVDDPPNATAYGGAIVRRGTVTIAISTAGEAPALARLLREILEQALPDEGFVEAARALRAQWKTNATPMASRFGELVRAFRERASPGQS